MVSRIVPAPVVVCVDDDPQVLTAVKRLLRREPVELKTTARAETALRWLGEGNVGLLITDLRMPGMDGGELIRVVEERFPGTPSLILTGYPDLAPEAPHPRMISKPWDDAELKDAIRSAIRPGEPAGIRGRLVVVGSDERLRMQVLNAVSRQSFEGTGVAPGVPRPPAEVVVIDADAHPGPIGGDAGGAIVLVLADRPAPAEIREWYDAGVAQVVRKPVAPPLLRALLTNCVRLARVKRLEAEERALKDDSRAEEAWAKRARRWVLAKTLAPSTSRTGRLRAQVGLATVALAIGVLLAALWSVVSSPGPIVLPGGDGTVDRLWRMSARDHELRRWYLEQQLQQGRDLNDEVRRHYEALRREARWEPVRPVYPTAP